jgi:hypothetical protein
MPSQRLTEQKRRTNGGGWRRGNSWEGDWRVVRESQSLLSELLEIHRPIVMLFLVVMMAWNSSCSNTISLAQLNNAGTNGFLCDRVIRLIFSAFPFLISPCRALRIDIALATAFVQKTTTVSTLTKLDEEKEQEQ